MATTTRPPRDNERARQAGSGGRTGTAAGPAAPAGNRDGTPAEPRESAATGAPGPSAAPAPGPSPATTTERSRPTASSRLDDLDLPPRRARRGKTFLLLVPILLVAIAAGVVLGYRYWYESTYFVSTDNAQITGDLVQVGSLNAGRIVASRLEVGAPVRAGQELAVVAMPQQVGSSVAGNAPRLDVVPTTDALVSVPSPMDGVIAARTGFVGATVAAGQPIYSIVDPRKVWVKANIEEGKLWQVKPGQRVAIRVDALNREIAGRVQAITPASAATFALLPTGNLSGNFVKVVQYVPVKIVPDEIDAILPLGTSVEVRIEVRETTEELPLPWRP